MHAEPRSFDALARTELFAGSRWTEAEIDLVAVAVRTAAR